MRDTIDQMLVKAGAYFGGEGVVYANFNPKKFAELVRADEREIEREACAELVYNSPPSDEYESQLKAVYDAIRNRGNT